MVNQNKQKTNGIHKNKILGFQLGFDNIECIFDRLDVMDDDYYETQIKGIFWFSQACRKGEVLELLLSIADMKFNLKSILEFYDQHANLSRARFDNILDIFVYTEFVELAVKQSFKYLSKQCRSNLVTLRQDENFIQDKLYEIQVRGISDSIPDIYDIRDRVNRHSLWMQSHLYFLPHILENTTKSDKLIGKYFANWFRDSTCYEVIFGRFDRQIKALLLGIPNSSFNDRYPTIPRALNQSESLFQNSSLLIKPLMCDLCLDMCVCRAICNTCKNKTVCYSCFRQIAWAKQHDEFRAFSEWRMVPCPFCKSILDHGTGPTPIVVNIISVQAEFSPTRQNSWSNEENCEQESKRLRMTN